MNYRKLGNTELIVSEIGLGTYAVSGVYGRKNPEDIKKVILKAFELGITYIDTAPVYGDAEKLLGELLKGTRDKIVLSTKFSLIGVNDENIENYITSSLQNSLKNLETDYIDLYQTHWPDPQTPPSETMEALLELKDKGYIRAIGVSNVSIDLMKEFAKFGQIDTDQENYSLIDRKIEQDLLPWCKENQVTMIAYSPLSKGLLTGKLDPKRKFTKDDIRVFSGDKRFLGKNIENTNNLLKQYLLPVAQKHNATIGNIAVSYLIQNEMVVALCGARNSIQAAENALAGDIILDDEDKKMVELFIRNYKET